MKTETKAELRSRISELEGMVKTLSARLEAKDRVEWEKKIPIATVTAYKALREVHPRTVYDLTFAHVDKSGYWYTYQLVNDDRRQTYCVKHEELEDRITNT